MRGARRSRATAAASTPVTSKATGTAGKRRLMARAAMVAAKSVGKIAPPIYPLLNESARSRTFLDSITLFFVQLWFKSTR